MTAKSLYYDLELEEYSLLISFRSHNIRGCWDVEYKTLSSSGLICYWNSNQFVRRFSLYK